MSRLRFVDQTGSTNRDLIHDPSAVEGDWLIAAVQTAGRGRQGREWQSQTGNFFGSTVIVLRIDDPAAQSLALVAGLALAEALDVAAPTFATMLKWPNDVMLDGRKLAGILLERSGDRVVAGFGVNLAVSPAGLDRPVADLGAAIVPSAFAPLLAASFARMLDLWRTADAGLFAQAWLARAHPLGTPLTVHGDGGEILSGRFDGIDHDGALRLMLDGGEVRTVHAGDVALG